MPEKPDPTIAVDVDVLIAYAGWLEGSSAVMKDCHDLVTRWCNPPAWAYGVDVPIMGETARGLYAEASGAIAARAEELQSLAGALHGMALGLAQVAANYRDTDVSVVANFGGSNDANPKVRATLPSTYDFVVRPHR